MARGQRNGAGKGSERNENGQSHGGGETGFQEQAERDGPKETGFAEAPGNGHNSARAQRLEAEDKAIAKWCALQDEEDRLIEKYLDPIRKKKAKLKADLKSEYDIPVQAFNARANMRRIELTGEDEVVLATRELFEATPVGKNLDFVVLAERVKQKQAEKAAAAAKAKATEHEVA